MKLIGTLRKQVEETAQELGHDAEVAHGLSMEELPDWISHHIGDAKEIEFAGGHWSLESLSLDPLQLGSVVIDLSPTRQLMVMIVVAILLPLIFIPVARAIRSKGLERAPSGFARVCRRNQHRVASSVR